MSKSLTSLQKAINKAYGVAQHRDVVIGRLVGVIKSFDSFLTNFRFTIFDFLKSRFANYQFEL